MLLRGKIILNIFSFRGHSTLKPRSKLISKNLFLFISKINDQKLEFNTPLSSGVARGATGGTRPEVQALGAHQHTSAVILNVYLSRNLSQNA